jgi:tetratricopeptide (TPR) repeat protein
MQITKLKEVFASLEADSGDEPIFLRTFIEVTREYLERREYDAACASMQLFVTHFPMNGEGYTLLGHSYVGLQQYEKAIECYDRTVTIDPTLREAFLGLARVYETLQCFDLADQTWRRGFGFGAFQMFQNNAREDRPIRILLLASVLPGNLRYPLFIGDPRFQIIVLYAESALPELVLPAHDIVFSVIGDPELCGRALERAQLLTQTIKAPILNHPSSVAHTGREENAKRLGRLDNVVAPLTMTLDRERLLREDAERVLLEHGFFYPFLLRSQGCSNGDFFEKVETKRDIARVLELLPGKRIIVIQYIDMMKSDGVFQKYRMMGIDKRLYPLHLAISKKWKVHYFSANMNDEQAFRDEEQAYLSDPAAVLGPQVIKALTTIVETLNLDYCGIDFTVNEVGKVVVFEANSNMEMALPENAPPWEYRRKPIQNAIDAAKALIYRAVPIVNVILGQALS